MSKRRLRLWLGVFFLALALPTAGLVRHTYTQLKWEAFHRHRLLAEELTIRIDSRLADLIDEQEQRRFADYGFLVVAGDSASSVLQRSPLSTFPVQTGIPGMLGFFQVDADGAFSTPLLPHASVDPADYGILRKELRQRRELVSRLRQILVPESSAEAERSRALENRATELKSAPAAIDAPLEDSVARVAGEDSADDVEEGQVTALRRERTRSLEIDARLEATQKSMPGQIRIDELDLDDRYRAEALEPQASMQAFSGSGRTETRVSRKERTVLPGSASREYSDEAEAAHGPLADVRIDVFESEIDPFELSFFDDAHFVLYRKVWREGSRYIQGAIIEIEPFVLGLVGRAFNQAALSSMSDLVVAYQGNVLSILEGSSQGGGVYGEEEISGSLLYRARLSSPLSDLELIFTVTRLSPGPGGPILNWMAGLLALVLIGGTYSLYRLGLGQIQLARQQQDFVSAVSHELKTPLTSIRMYGEMLLEGWASEDKKRSYYRFIYDESERLSRLIGNVLQLARLTRNELQIEQKAVSVEELIELIQTKTSAQIEHAGFELEIVFKDEVQSTSLHLDPDWVSQVFINLVDNAVKFAARAESKRIELICGAPRKGMVLFRVRDYGPGIGREQTKKIFRLFYRSENELTRETVGTGIGLALVRELVQRMDGSVDVVNRDPGAEFRVTFPVARSS